VRYASRRKMQSRAAAAALLLVPLRLVLAAAQLVAQPGDLRFTPAEPHVGQRVAVTYLASDALKNRDRLVLRARYRSIHSNAYSNPPVSDGMVTVLVTSLARDRGGIFAGSFTLPDSVIYAVFVVEDSSGMAIDTHGGQLWELLTYEADGRPSFDALEQRVNDLMGRNWEEGFATARRMVALYPTLVRGWTQLFFFQGWLVGSDKTDSILGLHRRKFAEFERRFADTVPPTRDDVVGMTWYADRLANDGRAHGDSVAAEHWLARVTREAPANSFALRIHAYRAYRRARSEPRVALAELDSLWQLGLRGDSASCSLGGFSARLDVPRWGFRAARVAGDTTAMLRWVERIVLGGRYAKRRYATLALDIPPLRPTAMDWLRQELRLLDEHRVEYRWLGETVAEQRARDAREARSVLGSLGKALAVAGSKHAALDTLALAAAAGWDPQLFRTIATARLAVGDTAGALEMLAWVIADPRSSPALADSIAPMANGLLGPATWEGKIAAARATLAARVLAEAIEAPLKGAVRLSDAAGHEQDLSTIARGRVTFVFFWASDCQPAMQELPAADSVATILARQGIAVVSVTQDAPSPALSTLIGQKRLVTPVLYDLRKDVARAFDQWGTPAYFVLDAQGRLRFRSSSDPLAVLVQARALAARPATRP